VPGPVGVGVEDRPAGLGGLEALVTALRCYEPIAIYLFGSRARGTARPDSDFDLALLLDDGRSLPIDDWLTACDRLAALAGSEVDLVVLNEARPHVRVEILRTGKVLYESDPAVRLVLEKRILGGYDDVRKCLLPRGVSRRGRRRLYPEAEALAHHYLWRCCQGLLDLARVIAQNVGGLTRPSGSTSYGQVFIVLGQHAVLAPPLVRKGQAVADLRNRLVHEYLALGPAEMGRLLRLHVPAIEEMLRRLAAAQFIGPVAPESSRPGTATHALPCRRCKS